jgi:hypothetical protein
MQTICIHKFIKKENVSNRKCTFICVLCGLESLGHRQKIKRRRCGCEL